MRIIVFIVYLVHIVYQLFLSPFPVPVPTTNPILIVIWQYCQKNELNGSISRTHYWMQWKTKKNDKWWRWWWRRWWWEEQNKVSLIRKWWNFVLLSQLQLTALMDEMKISWNWGDRVKMHVKHKKNTAEDTAAEEPAIASYSYLLSLSNPNFDKWFVCYILNQRVDFRLNQLNMCILFESFLNFRQNSIIIFNLCWITFAWSMR